MFKSFKYESISLGELSLDDRNPRIVSQRRLSSQDEIVRYLFEHDDLDGFIKKIVSEGKNLGAERPYVVKSGRGYTVVEGNTRVAAYKVLTGLLTAPSEYASSIPKISAALRKSLLTVDCSVAPTRDSLLPIMASAHFGRGDKSKWGYLGSRKAVYDEWKLGKSVSQLARAFQQNKSDIQNLILEYTLYLEAIALRWSHEERAILQDPAVEFNPPVRFLQTKGHKEKIGIRYDQVEMAVVFDDVESKKKFKHLVTKLVVRPTRGLGATASYDDVFGDFLVAGAEKRGARKDVEPDPSDATTIRTKPGREASPSSKTVAAKTVQTHKLETGALFSYPVTLTNSLILQLMKEAKSINSLKFPAASTFLLRNIIEAILKHIIDHKGANPNGTLLDLERSIGICMAPAAGLDPGDKKVLKEFQKHYLSYINLGAHGNIIPNSDMVLGARDCIDQFIRRNV